MTTTDADLFSTLMSPEARHDPYPLFAELRRKHCVADTEQGISFVFGYNECLSLLRDRRNERRRVPLGSGSAGRHPHADPPGPAGS